MRSLLVLSVSAGSSGNVVAEVSHDARVAPVSRQGGDAESQVSLSDTGEDDGAEEEVQLTRESGFTSCCSARDWPKMYATLSQIRHLGSMEPAEIYHVDGELDEKAIAMLESIPSVKVRDLKDVLRGASKERLRQYRSYMCLPAALRLSSFRVAVLHTSDALFFKNPDVLWDHPRVQRDGIFFLNHTAGGQYVSDNGGKKCNWIENYAKKHGLKLASDFRKSYKDTCTNKNRFTLCSTMVAVDKGHHPKMLRILRNLEKEWLQPKGNLAPITLGDTDLFWMACELAGESKCPFFGIEKGLVHAPGKTNWAMADSWTLDAPGMSGDLLTANLNGRLLDVDSIDAISQVTWPQQAKGVRPLTWSDREALHSWLEFCYIAVKHAGVSKKVCNGHDGKLPRETARAPSPSIIRSQNSASRPRGA